MRLLFALLPLTLAVVGCGPSANSSEPSPLLGTWKVSRFERWGGPWSMDDVVTTWEITEQRVACSVPNHFAAEGSYQVRAAKNPPQIDIRTLDGKVIPGIYTVEGDTLQLCIDHNGERRPDKFASEGKSEIWLIVLTREKGNAGQAKK